METWSTEGHGKYAAAKPDQEPTSEGRAPLPNGPPYRANGDCQDRIFWEWAEVLQRNRGKGNRHAAIARRMKENVPADQHDPPETPRPGFSRKTFIRKGSDRIRGNTKTAKAGRSSTILQTPKTAADPARATSVDTRGAL